MDLSASRTTLTCAGVLCGVTIVTGIALERRGERVELGVVAPPMVEPPPANVHVDSAIAHEDFAPFAGLFVTGARWTLPCFDESVNEFPGAPERVVRSIATGDRHYAVVEVRTVAGVRLAHITELGWFAMTGAGIYELRDSSWYSTIDLDPKADPDVPPHLTRYFFEHPRSGGFDASDAALLKRRVPTIASPPRETDRFEPGPDDQHNLDEDPSYQPHGDGCGRDSYVFPYDGGWCVETSVSCGGGAHETFLCVAEGRGLIGIGAGKFEGIYVGERCGDSPP